MESRNGLAWKKMIPRNTCDSDTALSITEGSRRTVKLQQIHGTETCASKEAESLKHLLCHSPDHFRTINVSICLLATLIQWRGGREQKEIQPIDCSGRRSCLRCLWRLVGARGSNFILFGSFGIPMFGTIVEEAKEITQVMPFPEDSNFSCYCPVMFFLGL